MQKKSSGNKYRSKPSNYPPPENGGTTGTLQHKVRMEMKNLIELSKKQLVPGAWKKMSYLKRLHIILEYWCSQQTICAIRTHRDNYYTTSPSGLDWALFEIPWYFRLVSKIEFQLRYLVYPKPECIKGFFPFYRRKK